MRFDWGMHGDVRAYWKRLTLKLYISYVYLRVTKSEKNSRGRGVQSMSLKQVSIEIEVSLELKNVVKKIIEFISNMLQNKFARSVQE